MAKCIYWVKDNGWAVPYCCYGDEDSYLEFPYRDEELTHCPECGDEIEEM